MRRPRIPDRRLRSKDSSIALRDAQTGSELGEPLLGHDAEVTALAFSPDGARLASADAEGTVLVWPVSVEAWKERCLPHPGGS